MQTDRSHDRQVDFIHKRNQHNEQMNNVEQSLLLCTQSAELILPPFPSRNRALVRVSSLLLSLRTLARALATALRNCFCFR